MVIEAVCGCNIGKLRKNNEDNLFFNGRWLDADNNGIKHPLTTRISNEDSLFAVFDGMGGEECGEIAAYIAASETDVCFEKSKKRLFSPRTLLEELCVKLNNAVYSHALKHSVSRMGSTMAAVFFRDEEIYACNIGDSRIFQIRKNSFLQISEDHVEILPPNANHKPRLTQHLGMDPTEIAVEPHIAKGKLLRGDQYLICSDGLTDMLSNIEIHSIIKSHAGLKTAMEALINAALEKGGKDNVTAILCRVR